MQITKKNKLILLLFSLVTLWGAPLYAAKVNGVLTAGSYSAFEKFSQASDGTNRNDIQTVSSRAYLKVSEMGDGRFETAADLRDKHDFFDKVDKQRLELTDSNTFQVRQLYLRYPGQGFFATAGRFAISEAGGAFADGAEMGVSPFSNWKVAGFGGLNPKRPDQAAMTYNPNSYLGGGYLLYQPPAASWESNFYMTNAVVSEMVKSEIDRNYWFHNTVFQWSRNSRLILMSYLDFVPRTYFQIGSLIYQQTLSPYWSSNLNLLAVDSLGYIRRQDIRETLQPSPYKEAGAKIRFRPHEALFLELGASNGKREVDNLNRSDFNASINFPNLWTRRFDGFLKAGLRDNFTTRDSYGGYGLGYFSRSWEFTWDQTFGNEQHKTEDTNIHSVVSELSLAHYFENMLYLTLSAQDARDERVQITSGFFKLTYRFGNRELAPIRDGAPPRGRL